MCCCCTGFHESGESITIRLVGAGRQHSIALDTCGRVWSWGCGEDGALGHGNLESHYTPKLVERLAHVPIAEVQCGSRHVMAVPSSELEGTCVCGVWTHYAEACDQAHTHYHTVSTFIHTHKYSYFHAHTHILTCTCTSRHRHSDWQPPTGVLLLVGLGSVRPDRAQQAHQPLFANADCTVGVSGPPVLTVAQRQVDGA